MTEAHVINGRRSRGPGAGSSTRLRTWLVAGALVIAVVLLVLVIGGYFLHWHWTGLSDSVTLWDWLEVLALPVALGAAPILMRHRHRMHRRHRRALAGSAFAFGGLVIAGYLVPVSWTGFTGNTLWDWLSLLLLPAVVATASVWATTWPPPRSLVLAVMMATVVLIALAIPGYLVPWKWTGFAGNTAWDWVKLLLLPLIVPLALLPPVTKYVTDRLAAADRASAPPPGGATEPRRSVG